MRDLVGVAETVRFVRSAAERFFWRGQMEQVMIGSDVLDRLAADVERIDMSSLDFAAWMEAEHPEQSASVYDRPLDPERPTDDEGE